MRVESAGKTKEFAFEAILEQLTEGVIVIDAAGTILFVNDAAATIHGVASLGVKPTAYSDTYHLFREDGRPYPWHELPLARAVRGETVKNERWRIRRPDGQWVLAVGSAQPLFGPNRQRIGAVLTLRDETARERAEQALEASETALRQANETLARHRRDIKSAEGHDNGQETGGKAND